VNNAGEMALPTPLRTTITICMFDQYGTVVDMQTGLTEIAAPFLESKGWAGNPSAFVTWWRRTHFENSMIDALLHKGHTPYREIGHRSGFGDALPPNGDNPSRSKVVPGGRLPLENTSCGRTPFDKREYHG
jgi:hypothetical protein